MNAFIRSVRALCLALLFCAWAVNGMAQPFPARPIKFIVPYPAGGGADTLSRQLAAVIGAKYGQTVVVENKPGAAGSIAAQALLGVPADGYTVALFDSSTVSINPHLIKKLAYDPAAIAPVTGLLKIPLAMMVASTSPIKTLKEYVDAAKAEPGAMSYGSSGAGNPVHLSMERFKSTAGIDVTHVPYRGGAPALQDLVGGQISSLMLDLPSAMPFINSGRVRVLAVASPTRSPVLSDVPTIAESGYPKFAAIGWSGLFVAVGTPEPVIAQLNAIFREALVSPNVATWIKSVSSEPGMSSPGELARVVKSDSDSYGAVIRRVGITLD